MTTKKTTATLSDAALINEAEAVLSAHIQRQVAGAIRELTEHYPAYLAHSARPTTERPAGVPEWVYIAFFDATNEYDELCWPILRGSLMSRAYSMTGGCPVAHLSEGVWSGDASLALRKALIQIGAVTSYYDVDDDDEDHTAGCAHVCGDVIAKGLGVSLYQRLNEHFQQIEDECKEAFQAA